MVVEAVVVVVVPELAFPLAAAAARILVAGSRSDQERNLAVEPYPFAVDMVVVVAAAAEAFHTALLESVLAAIAVHCH